MNSKKRITKSTKETSKKGRLIPEALLPSSESDDLDLDKDSDCGGGSYVDVESVLSSEGESDSEPTDLNDLGLLTELLNDEVTDKWKKKLYQQQYVDFNKLYYDRDDHQVHMVVKKNRGNSITSVTNLQEKLQISPLGQRPFNFMLACTAAFTYFYDPAILRNKVTALSIFKVLALKNRDS